MSMAMTTDAPKSVAALRREIAARLRAAGIENAALDARVLVAHGAGLDPGELPAQTDREIDADAAQRVEQWTSRRIAGEPVARILGMKEFWSLCFKLGPDTLVPRPETETLVEAAVAARPERNAALRVLDLGTGSGALLAALLSERPFAFGIGVDRSFSALATARANLDTLGLGERAQFVCANWGDALAGPFDIVVANPPYIASDALRDLPREVREHDPRLALDGGRDGYDAYRAICGELKRLLGRHGIAILEIGEGQEAGVAAIARSLQLTVNGPVRCDLAGRPRAVVLTA
jgi:release factor glutamine methyltransferase